MRTDGIEKVTIEEESAEAIRYELEAVLSKRRFMVDRDAAEMAVIAGGILRKHIGEVLEEEEALKAGAIVIEGLPVLEVVPETPFQGFGNDVLVQFSDALQLGVFLLLGIAPVAYSFENDGRLFRNVVPNPNKRGSASSQGFDQELGWHTDNPCASFEGIRDAVESGAKSPIPHYLALASLKNRDADGRSVATELVLVEEVLKRLGEDTVYALGEEEFMIEPPESNSCEGCSYVALLQRDKTGYVMRYDANRESVYGLTRRGIYALEEFDQELEAEQKNAIQIHLEPGMMLIFDNYKVLHRRKSFAPGDNLANSRWLRRCFGLRSPHTGEFVDRLSWPHLLR